MGFRSAVNRRHFSRVNSNHQKNEKRVCYYSEEQKQKAIAIAKKDGATQAARRTSISLSQIREWTQGMKLAKSPVKFNKETIQTVRDYKIQKKCTDKAVWEAIENGEILSELDEKPSARTVRRWLKQ